MVYMHLFLFSFRSVFFNVQLPTLVISQCFDQVPLFTLFQFDSFPTQTGLEIMPLLYTKPTRKQKKHIHKLCACCENPSLLPKEFPGLYGYLVISIMLAVLQLNMPFLRLVFSMIF